MTQRRFVLFGYLGARNFGDDLMLLGLLATLAGRAVDLTILVRDPGSVSLPDMPGAQVRTRQANAKALVSLLRPGTTFVRVGGTSFHDEYERRSMVTTYLKLTAMFWLPRRIGGASAALGVGAGQIRRRSTRFLARTAMQAARAVLARDPQSSLAFEALAPRANVIAGIDLATLLPMPKPRQDAQAPQHPVGVSILDLAPYVDNASTQAVFWQASVAAFLEACPAATHVRLFVFKDNDSESDRPVSEQLLRDLETVLAARNMTAEIVVTSDRGFQDVLQDIADCRAFLATRYHAALLAAQADVPVAVVRYNAKLGYMADDYQLAEASVIAPLVAPTGPVVLSPPRPSQTVLDRRAATLDLIDTLFGKD